MLGRVIPSTMTAFSVNNPHVLAHECHHIEAIMNNEGTSGEIAKDSSNLLGLNDLMTVAAILFLAPNNCGDGSLRAFAHHGRLIGDVDRPAAIEKAARWVVPPKRRGAGRDQRQDQERRDFLYRPDG